MSSIANVSTALTSELIDKAEDYARASMSKSTVRAYRSAWRMFTTWCSSIGMNPLPAVPEVVALYITHRADIGMKVSTIESDIAAIAAAHKAVKLDSPTSSPVVKTVMKGIRRTVGTAPAAKSPVLMSELRRMVMTLPDDNRGTRDHAVLVVGFAGAFRRSELANLNLSDITITNEGIRVVLRRSKTDQEGRGRVVGLPFGSHPATCPVRVLSRWIAIAEIETGPLFRSIDRADNITDKPMSSKAVARAVKRAAKLAGMDPTTVSGHSLRSGFCTSAARAGATERCIARQTGHRSMAVLRGYIRDGTIWSDNPASMVGL